MLSRKLWFRTNQKKCIRVMPGVMGYHSSREPSTMLCHVESSRFKLYCIVVLFVSCCVVLCCVVLCCDVSQCHAVALQCRVCGIIPSTCCWGSPPTWAASLCPSALAVLCHGVPAWRHYVVIAACPQLWWGQRDREGFESGLWWRGGWDVQV